VVATVSDANYQGGASGTLTIAKAPTTVSIASATPNPSGYGQPVTVTAAVSPAGGSGKVRFSNGQGWQEAVDVSTLTGTAQTTATLPAGTHSVTAQYLGDANYAQSPVSTGVSLLVNKAVQTISFPSLPAKTYGDPAFALSGTASSGLSVSYASSNPAVAMVSGNTVTILGAGTASITASQGGDGNYAAATAVTQTLVVNKATANVTLGSLTTTYDGTPRPATASTVPAGLAVNLTYNGLATAPSAAGSYAVVATVNDANYQGSANGTLTVAKADQTIAFAALPAKTYGDPSFALTATATSGLSVSYASSNPAVATVSGSTVTILGAGTATITASQGGDGNYNPASSVAQALVVNKTTLNVTAANVSRVYGGANPTFSVTYSGFVNGDTQSALTGSPSLTTSATPASPAGTYPIVPSVGTLDAANYTFEFINGTLTIIKAEQTINFTPLASQTYGDPSLTLAATATSGLVVSYTSSNPAVATVSGNTVTIVGAGTTTITASQVGDANYNPAPPVSQPLTVNKATATVTLGNLSATYDGTPKAATATTNPPGLAVTFTYDGSTTPPTKKGTYTVVGTVNDVNYQGSATGTLTITRGTQKITFAPLPGKTYGDAPFDLSATSSSGLPVTYTSSNTAVATVSGSTVTILSAGTTTITASQSGDNNFNAAQSVSQTLTVAKALLTVTATNASRVYGSANPTLGAIYSGFVNTDTQAVLGGAPSVTTTATPATPAGNSTITAAIGTLTAANYTFAFANGTLTITKAPLTVTPADASRVYGAADPTFTASYTGFVNGDTEAVVSGSPAFATTATAASPVGSYPIVTTVGSLGAANYGFVFSTATLTVTKANQSISFPPIPAKTYGDAPFSLAAAATSGLPVSYTSSNPAVATVSGSTVTILSAGTTTITASQGGDGNFNAATNIPQTMTVNALSQGIKLNDNGNTSYYGTLMSAYNAIVDGTNAVILLASGNQTETLIFDKNYRVTLAGGYDQALSAVTGVTTLRGSLTFMNGTVNIDGSLSIMGN
ncbi:MAG TPA: MBG domain-containing protein, partial [Geobacteraceae bacterium]